MGFFALAPLDQHAFQAPDDDNGQDDRLVFVGFELAAQAFGGFPNFVGEIVEFGLVECGCHKFRSLLAVSSRVCNAPQGIVAFSPELHRQEKRLAVD